MFFWSVVIHTVFKPMSDLTFENWDKKAKGNLKLTSDVYCMTGNWYGKLTVTPLYVCVTICVRETDLIHMILWHHSGVIWTGLASKDRVCSRLFNLKEPLKFTGCTCWIQACDSGMQLKKPLCTPTDIFLFIYSLISGSLPLSVKSKAFLYDQEKKCCQS